MTSGAAVRAVSYRVRPGKRSKARKLHRLAGACRFVWNQVLADQDDLYRIVRMNGAKPPSVSFFTLSRVFTELRSSPEGEWLQDLPYKEVRYGLKRQADAWQRHFKGQSGRPKFKSRHAASQGFTIPENVRIEDGRIFVPKTGWYRLQRKGGNPYPDGSPKQAVFKCEPDGKWFCTVFYEVAVEERDDDGSAIGVDRNVGQCATSEGDIHRLPDSERLEARRRRYQRRMARQKRGSGRYKRTKAKLYRTSRRIADRRSDWCHQTSRRMANTAYTVALEDLNTRGMTRSGTGKRGLNRGVLASGWGQLERNLGYKAGRVVHVDPAYTSQTCHECGHVDKANRPTQDTFRCTACGHTANADVNAAMNIRRLGMAQLDAEGRGRSNARPVIRQIGTESRLAA